MFKKLNVDEFIHQLASPSPAPKGSTVAALAAAQAAGLLSMYCNVSQNPGQVGNKAPRLRLLGEEARFLLSRLLEVLDEDTFALSSVMQAASLPGNTEQELLKKQQQLEKAAEESIEVPLKTARGSLLLLALISETAAKGNKASLSDLGVANLQAATGLHGACYHLISQFERLSEGESKQQLNLEILELCSQGDKIFQANRMMIEKDLVF